MTSYFSEYLASTVFRQSNSLFDFLYIIPDITRIPAIQCQTIPESQVHHWDNTTNSSPIAMPNTNHRFNIQTILNSTIKSLTSTMRIQTPTSTAYKKNVKIITKSFEQKWIPEEANELLDLHWRPIEARSWADPIPPETGEQCWKVATRRSAEPPGLVTTPPVDLNVMTADPAAAAMRATARIPSDKFEERERKVKSVLRNEEKRFGFL